VEHTSAVVYKPQTVFQPVMKNKKCVTKQLSTADMKGASKYCLLTQEPDSDGDIQTRLYKGEINPTITGGANMVLRDVEQLTQLSPGGSPCRKRPSTSPTPVRSRRSRGIGVGGESTNFGNEVAERCRQGISSVGSRHSRQRDE